MNLPSISSYGNYTSNNYGVNTMRVNVAGVTVYFSYRTPVAFHTYESGLVVHENVWGVTTGKHLNWIDSDKSKRVSAEKFKELWKKYVGEKELVSVNV